MDVPQIEFDFIEPHPPKKEHKGTAPIKTTSMKSPVNGSGKVKSTRGRKSLKSYMVAADLINVPGDEVLFEKSYYSMGDVTAMFNLNASLIRFWENEFDVLQPKKNGKGDRYFRPEDVKTLQLIYHLLRERKYTMEGAKEFLKTNKKGIENFKIIESLKKLRSFLLELKASL